MNGYNPGGLLQRLGGRGAVLGLTALDGIRRYLNHAIGYAPSRAQLITALQNVPQVAYEDAIARPIGRALGTWQPSERSQERATLRYIRNARGNSHFNNWGISDRRGLN